MAQVGAESNRKKIRQLYKFIPFKITHICLSYLNKQAEYIYILSSTDRSVSFNQNSFVWLDRLDSRSWDRNPVNSNVNPRFYHSATSASEGNVNAYVSHLFLLAYIRDRELDSYEEPCITLVANLLLPSLESSSIQGQGSIYIVIHRQTVSFYQYSSVWLERLDSRSWDRNLLDCNANPRFYHTTTRKPAGRCKYRIGNMKLVKW